LVVGNKRRPKRRQRNRGVPDDKKAFLLKRRSFQRSPNEEERNESEAAPQITSSRKREAIEEKASGRKGRGPKDEDRAGGVEVIRTKGERRRKALNCKRS